MNTFKITDGERVMTLSRKELLIAREILNNELVECRNSGLGETSRQNQIEDLITKLSFE